MFPCLRSPAYCFQNLSFQQNTHTPSLSKRAAKSITSVLDKQAESSKFLTHHKLDFRNTSRLQEAQFILEFDKTSSYQLQNSFQPCEEALFEGPHARRCTILTNNTLSSKSKVSIQMHQDANSENTFDALGR